MLTLRGKAYGEVLCGEDLICVDSVRSDELLTDVRALFLRATFGNLELLVFLNDSCIFNLSKRLVLGVQVLKTSVVIVRDIRSDLVIVIQEVVQLLDFNSGLVLLLHGLQVSEALTRKALTDLVVELQLE